MFNQNHLGGEPERKHNCALSTNQIAENCSKNLLTSILIGRERGWTETSVFKSDILKFTNELSDWSRAWSAAVIRLDQRPDQKLIWPEWRPDQTWSETWSKLIRPEWRPDWSWSDQWRPDQGDQTWSETWSEVDLAWVETWSDLIRDLIEVDQTWVETWSKLIRPEWRPDQGDQTWVETWSRWSDLSGDLIKVIRPEWRPDQSDLTSVNSWSDLIGLD